MIQRLLNPIRGLLASSQGGLSLTTKLRNQCQIIIARAHSATRYPEVNGEARWLRAVLDQIQYAVDVGANRGDWTNMVLQGGRAEHLLLIEPSSSAQEKLRRRFSGNPHVEIVEAAAGSAPGMLPFFEEPDAGETSSLLAGFSQENRKRQVQVTTVDGEVGKRKWPRVDFLKIDAEGFDFRVLEGCRQLFLDGKVRYGQFEYNGPWRLAGATLTFALRWLQDLGYECFLVLPDGLHQPKTDVYWDYYSYSNYAIIRQDLVADIMEAGRLRATGAVP